MKKLIKVSAMLLVAVVAAVLLLEFTSSYTTSTNVNQDAPVKTLQSIRIHASSQKVYAVFTNVQKWPEWQKEITAAKLNGPLQPGSFIEWSTAGMNIKSTLQTVKTNQQVGWCGKAFGAFAIHTWQFKQQDGYTTVVVNESMEGWMVKLMKGYFQKNLNIATKNWLQALKNEAEKG